MEDKTYRLNNLQEVCRENGFNDCADAAGRLLALYSQMEKADEMGAIQKLLDEALSISDALNILDIELQCKMGALIKCQNP